MAIIPRTPFYPISYFMPFSMLHTSAPLDYHHLIRHLKVVLAAHGDCLFHLKCLNLLENYCSALFVKDLLVADLLR